jgi:type II secretory ATPase GspE/PulE/Tfp pilus assembly ATPase PilB-like protein
MFNLDKPWILAVDDDTSLLDLENRFLSGEGYNVITAQGGNQALAALTRYKPDLILLDVMMPGMDGYQVCEQLQANPETAYIPVVFVTALDDEQDRARAFSVGAVDYLVKPIDRQQLKEMVARHLETGNRFAKTQLAAAGIHFAGIKDNENFGQYIADSLSLTGAARELIISARPGDIYKAAFEAGVDSAEIARLMARFRDWEYWPLVFPDTLRMDILPVPFCRANRVVMVNHQGSPRVVLSNPYDFLVMDSLSAVLDLNLLDNMVITEPETIEDLLSKSPAEYYSDRIVSAALYHDASDIWLEIRPQGGQVQLRFNGIPHDLLRVSATLYPMLVSRLKILGNMNIAEKRRPQSGAFNARGARFRLTTAPVAEGENMFIRVLPPLKGSLGELGLPATAVAALKEIFTRRQGIMVFTGTEGSGRSTTACTLLKSLHQRTLVTIEDPIEYDLPQATQQQVNPRAELTTDQLVKSAFRQNPDVLYISELSDQQSALQLSDLSLRGTLTVTAMLATDTAAALTRLEGLGLSRRQLAEHVHCVLAQRLLPRLCPLCKRVVPITPAEEKTLADLVQNPPGHLARAVGCSQCNSGYSGRVAVFELLVLDGTKAAMIRSGRPFAALRHQLRVEGFALLYQQGIELLAKHQCAYGDVWENILKDETLAIEHKDTHRSTLTALVVDDDPDARLLLTRFLEQDGWQVTPAADGIDALLALGRGTFDLILADVDMPNLDGFQLMEMNKSKGIDAPVIFVSAYDESPSITEKCRELGGAGYLVKPVSKEKLITLARQATGFSC